MAGAVKEDAKDPIAAPRLCAGRVASDVLPIWRFVHGRTGIPLSHTAKALAQLDRPGGEIQCGAMCEGFNGVNVWMHVAMTPGTHLMRDFVRYCFTYPFDELGVKRITGWVEASNTAARRFDERLGFKVEATLVGAATDGGDVLIYAMRREDCRPLRRRSPMASMAP